MPNTEMFEEYLSNSKIAFNNKQFNEALSWIQKALNENSEDVSANTQAGIISVVLKDFVNAKKYFQKAVDLNPENGDNLFNLGNAYFFNDEYNKALNYYSMADSVGCSDEAKSKLYHQMAIICSVTNNPQSALINYQKYEDCSGSNGVDATTITEKVKLYLLCNDIENALKCANQLVLVAPSEFDSYETYFQILTSVGKYDKAEQILNDAQKYATLTSTNKFTIELNKISILVGKAELDTNSANTYYNDALNQLDNLKSRQDIEIEKEDLDNILLTSAEIYLKLEKFDEAIQCVNEIRNGNKSTDDDALSKIEIEKIIDDNINSIEEGIKSGEIDENLLEYADIEYDDEGYQHRVIPDDAFDSLKSNENDQIPNDTIDKTSGYELSKELNDKLDFILVCSYAEKEDYINALKYAKILQSKDSQYYVYYGTYIEAFASKQLSLDNWKSTYDSAIVFFKSKMMKNHGDITAVVFRARLYAELGKFAKALEMANILPKEEQKSVLKYIEKYQQNNI